MNIINKKNKFLFYFELLKKNKLIYYGISLFLLTLYFSPLIKSVKTFSIRRESCADLIVGKIDIKTFAERFDIKEQDNNKLNAGAVVFCGYYSSHNVFNTIKSIDFEKN